LLPASFGVFGSGGIRAPNARLGAARLASVVHTRPTQHWKTNFG
jgi:hypothetical protein